MFSCFQLFYDDYVASGASSEFTGRAPKPREVPCSEARTLDSLGDRGRDLIEIENLRKEIKVLKSQCLTAIAQAKNSTEREEAALLEAKESTEGAHVVAVKLTQAMDREAYMLELMTTASQELIGKVIREPPSHSSVNSSGAPGPIISVFQFYTMPRGCQN